MISISNDRQISRVRSHLFPDLSSQSRLAVLRDEHKSDISADKLHASFADTQTPPQCTPSLLKASPKGEGVHPSQSGTLSKSSLYHRNLLIWEAINKLVSRGMTATRNDASVGHSACDAVAKELGRTYNGVLSVWLKMKRDVNEMTARLKKAK